MAVIIHTTTTQLLTPFQKLWKDLITEQMLSNVGKRDYKHLVISC